ncbi:uncharacterized protein LOC132188360 isoform X2 [Corylus avellana]|nr:uncharacterized protein LOC132188360 isoform X2 [Corylus avellana]XP_059458770.1 uncharacterized protein LOC132188360 isoform X2 [Corylus avellana]
MKTDIPVILDEAIVKRHPDFFWLGGGEVDLKLGIRTSEFINFVKPFIGRKAENIKLPSANEQSINEIQRWGVPKKPTGDREPSNEDWLDDERNH